MSWRSIQWLMVVCAVVALPGAGYAQEAAVSGTVTDSTGGVLPGVTITALHDATGNTFVGVTDERGAFRLPLRVGAFTVTLELSGFATLNRKVDLLIGQQVVVNLTMQPSTVQESVTVTGEAPLIDATSSTLSGNIDPRQMEDLPVNGRNWVDLTMLAPGSRVNAVNETPVASQSTTVSFQLNLDGQTVTNLVAVGFGQPRYSRDAIGEFEFITNRFDASQGRSSGVQVNAVTKSGTNTPSGTFSSYFRDDNFNAPDPISGTVIPYSDKQFSGTFGGPIMRDKFHYFGSYEFENEPQTYLYTTPYPRFNTPITGTREERKAIVRFDYQFSPQNRWTLRGTRYDNLIPYDSRYTGGSDRTPASAIGTNRRSEQILLTVTSVIGNRALNQIKVGHDGFHWNQFAHVRNANALVGQTAGLGAPNIQLNGFTLGQSHAITPQDIGQDMYLMRDDFTWSFDARGRHDVKMGGEYLYDFTFETVCNQCMGVLDARQGTVPASVIDRVIVDVNDVTTWNLALLTPYTRSYSRAIATTSSRWSRPEGNSGFTEYAPRHVVAGWIQDDWQISSRLTLNLGLRYDLAVGAYVNWVDFPPFLSANRPEDTNNWGPRAGFAYSWNDRTVIRGGFGQYFADVTAQPAIFTLRNVQQINPLILPDGRADFAADPFNGPAPNFDQAALLLCGVSTASNCLRRSVGNFVADDLIIPYSYQMSLGVQRQLGTLMSIEADWVYTGDRETLSAQNINIAYNPATGGNYPFTGGAANVNQRVYPNFGNLAVNRNQGKTNYHGLQMAFTKRMSSGWQASATYTMGDQWTFDPYTLLPGCQYPMTIAGTGAARCDVPITLAPDIAENEYYLGSGPSGTGGTQEGQRHRFTFNGIKELPWGFQVSGLYLFGDNGRATPISGVDTRAIGNANSRLRADNTIIERNTFDRSAISRVDMRIQKRLRIGGRRSIDGIFEVFNVFNRKNFNSWVTNLSNARNGQPQQDTNLAYAARMLQLGFRVAF